MHILITGGAGFIGSHLTERLLSLNYKVTVIDNFDNFYAKEIKIENLKVAHQNTRFRFIELDISNKAEIIENLVDKYDIIIHLAAKAGVLPSIKNAIDYSETNIIGTQNLLDFAKDNKVAKFIFASSSSVYGVNKNIPWIEKDNDLRPISPYSVTKVTGELLGKVYSELYGLPFIVLRFFTVYGPRQRPDLAIFKFVKMIHENKPITLYGNGETMRDYTFIDDIVNGIVGSISFDKSNFEIFNLGNSQCVRLIDLVEIIEEVVGKKAIINWSTNQKGDVPITYSDITKSKKYLSYYPKTSLYAGISVFYNWYKKNFS